MSLFADFQTSPSDWGESGDLGGSDAGGVPGASSQRSQPTFSFQHQDAPRASQWVSSRASSHLLTFVNLVEAAALVFAHGDGCFCVTVLSMPDTVEEMCPEMPCLDKLLKDVNDVSECGARYSDMPQVRDSSKQLLLLRNDVKLGLIRTLYLFIFFDPTGTYRRKLGQLKKYKYFSQKFDFNLLKSNVRILEKQSKFWEKGQFYEIKFRILRLNSKFQEKKSDLWDRKILILRLNSKFWD